MLNKIKPTLITLLKVIIGLSIFYLLLRGQDLNSILNYMSEIDLGVFLSASLVYSSIFYFFGLRWRSVNLIFSINISAMTLFKHHLIAFFFSNGLPSTIGGDFWRMKLLFPVTEKKAHAFLIPLIERLSGFFAVFILGIFSFLILSDQMNISSWNAVAITIVAVLIFIVMFSTRFSKRMSLVIQKIKSESIRDKFVQIIDAFYLVSHHKKNFFIAIFYSLFSQLIYATACLIIVNGLGQSIHFLDALIIVPVVYFVSILPISIGGYGLREGTFVLLLPLFGVDQDKVIAISFLLTLMQLTVSLFGGILFLFNKKEVTQ